MKTNYAHISILLDRSGSMDDCRQATIEGFNKFLDDQQKVPGEATITLVQFDDKYEVNYEMLPLKNAKFLDNKTYVPRGATALLDGIGKLINSTGDKLAAMKEEDRPSRVLFVIQTDGFENNSKEFDRSKIFDMIQRQRDNYNWNFVFLGANQDAIATATSIGVLQNSALSYDSSLTSSAFDSASAYAASYRCAATYSGAAATSFTEEDRKNAVHVS